MFIYAVSQQVFIVYAEPGTVLGSWEFAEKKEIKTLAVLRACGSADEPLASFQSSSPYTENKEYSTHGSQKRSQSSGSWKYMWL